MLRLPLRFLLLWLALLSSARIIDWRPRGCRPLRSQPLHSHARALCLCALR